MLTFLGVRFGSAELYGVLDHFPQVEDSIAVGRKPSGAVDEQVLLFVKLRKGNLDRELQDGIKLEIRTALKPRHVPAGIYQVVDIPYTVNGKKIENLIRDIVSGKPGKVTGTAANPECFEEYRQYARKFSELFDGVGQSKL
jgi:acetoacetyl-CoA synthetase